MPVSYARVCVLFFLLLLSFFLFKNKAERVGWGGEGRVVETLSHDLPVKQAASACGKYSGAKRDGSQVGQLCQGNKQPPPPPLPYFHTELFTIF